MLDWNPALYTRYEDERTRPAAELLARRFPQADVLGIDNSEAMLASARKRLPQARFEFGDIGRWTPDAAPDLIYANAALQWVPDHDTLIPRLFIVARKA